MKRGKSSFTGVREKITSCQSYDSRKSQFYIIAAVVLILVVSSVIILQTQYTGDVRDPEIYNLQEELNLETGYVYDFAIYQEKDIDEKIKEWGETYVEAVDAEDDEMWIIAWGNQSNISVLEISHKETGVIKIGGQEFSAGELKGESEKVPGPGPGDGEIELEFGEGDDKFSRTFNLREGENFFSVIKKGDYVTKDKDDPGKGPGDGPGGPPGNIPGQGAPQN